MKKLFLVGAIVASMAFSSSALAAVSYGEADSLDVSANTTAGTVSVETDLSSYDGQMTVVVMKGDAVDAAENGIIYVDQTAAGAGIFQDMAVINGLEAGIYTVRVGNTSGALLRKTFAINGTTADIEYEGDAGKIWYVTLNKAVFANGLDAFTAKFVTATENQEFAIGNIDDLNAALTAFEGEGNFEFYVGLETDKDITGADFTASTEDGEGTYGVNDTASWE